ncbi:hypothetical protein [Bosea sp. 685]|uniref:hypothetical protein n=1 Tax=Bosea sp. 685 TaxID=3080057 RepID=UPI002892A61C|nr:hypothetical protein [Bosea sp. 685]WNJ91651.1 hypothetical protein RMR04_04910 [Bosea sp. 685]
MLISTDTVAIDLSETRKVSERIRSMLLKLRADHDLAQYEYTHPVRIAPGEISHSHPVLTLNTMVREESALLSLYLHEQMHWYVTWYSHAHHDGWKTIWAELLHRYPNVPVAFPEGAHSAQSSYLHLIVNWLEIEATAGFLGREKAVEIAARNFVYSGLYRIVLADWDGLAALYASHGLTPIHPATAMADHDLEIAARMDEATTDTL